MKTIADIFQISQAKLQDGEWGVEIEVEGKKLPPALPPEHWRIEADGSLKAAESAEYVMPKPLSIEGVKESIDVLQAAFTANKTKIDESIRAGVHVHMNVQRLTIKQLFTFATVYFILEELLVKRCGVNREGNLFCLRAQDAEAIIFTIFDAVMRRDARLLANEDIRYCSLNFCALSKYGSVEFRSMRSTPDLSLIYEWVEILKELRDNALTFSDPTDVIMSMSGEGESNFLARILPSFHERFHYPDYEKSIRRGCRRIQMLAFGIEWETFGRESRNPFKPEVW